MVGDEEGSYINPSLGVGVGVVEDGRGREDEGG